MRTVTAIWMALVVVLAVSGIGWANGSTQTGSTTPALMNLELQNTSVTEGIRALFKDRGLSYRIEPGVSGKIVELTLKGITFEQALKAFTDAADLKYTIDEDGVYTISPKTTGVVVSTGNTQKTTTYERSGAQTAAAQPEATQPEAQQGYEQPAAVQPQQPAPPVPVAPGVQVLVGQQAPVMYGNPGLNFVDNSGYYGPSAYQIGNISVLDGGGWPAVTVGGYNPYILGIGQFNYPPPPGWVSPEMERLLRAQYVYQPQPYFINQY